MLHITNADFETKRNPMHPDSKPHAIIPRHLAMTGAVMAGRQSQEFPLHYHMFSCLIALIVKGRSGSTIGSLQGRECSAEDKRQF